MNGYASIQEALVHGTGRERQFLCHVHGDSNPSASVNSLTGVWLCYACGAKGKVNLDGVEMDPYALRRRIKDIEERVAASQVRYPESWLNVFDSMGPGEYWLSRFSAEACRRHRLGQTVDGKWATIPLRANSGEVMGVIMRTLTGDRRKYKYPNQARLSQRLYNYHRAEHDLVMITEGATDSIAIDEVTPGYSMAIYGDRLSRAQTQLLYRYSPRVILVATDQDEGGEKAYKSIQLQLGDFCVVQRLAWEGYKDVASIPLDERTEMVSWAVSNYGVAHLDRVG